MSVTVELDATTKYINIYAEWRYKELCKSIPGAKWAAKEQVWRLPRAWTSCLALRSTFKDDLVIGPELTQWAQHEVTSRIAPSMATRMLLTAEGDPTLYPHQRAGVKFLATARRALLADEPGLGKTAQAIRGLAELSKTEPVFPALVVVPNSLKKNWEREFAHWWPGVNVQVIHGTAIQRRKQFNLFLEPKEDEPRPHVVVVNWESLRSHSRLAPYGSIALLKCPEHGGNDEKVTPARCEVHERELNKIPFRSVVADEIHRSKNPSSKQSRALWAASGDATIRFAMTGTPIANDAVDLWAILHWINPEEWPSKTTWINRMVDTMMNAFGGMHVIGIKPQMEAEFHATIDPSIRRMLKSVVLPDLPPMVFERRDTEMSAKEKKAYIQMRDHMIAELETGTYVTAPSALTQTLRLLQFASAFATVEAHPTTGEPMTKLSEPSCKVNALMDDIKNGDFGNDSVAVCAVSKQLIDLLSAALTKEKIPHGLITGEQTPDQRQIAVDEFQAGKTKWILYTVQAGGVGITLTTARRLIRLQRPWSLVDDKQALDRVHRIGSQIHDSIIITDYVTADTVEDHVREVLETKADNFEQIVKDKDQLLAMLLDDKAGTP